MTRHPFPPAAEYATAVTIARPAWWQTIAATPVTAVAVIWLTTALISVFAPDMVTGSVMVTGTDPTRIPVAVLIAPVVGAVTTGLLALHHARRALDIAVTGK